MFAIKNEDTIDTHEYSVWFDESEEVLDLSAEFFDAFSYSTPSDLDELKDLVDRVPRPDDDTDSEHDYPDERFAVRDRDYWSIERMFEDL